MHFQTCSEQIDCKIPPAKDVEIENSQSCWTETYWASFWKENNLQRTAAKSRKHVSKVSRQNLKIRKNKVVIAWERAKRVHICAQIGG